MRILILANGDPPSPELAQRLAGEHDFLFATDGAAHRAEALGLTPHVISGDFDSVRMEAAQAAFPDAEFIPTPDQEIGDLEKALLLALERGAQSVTILGAAGGRMDHTLANFALLLNYHARLSLSIHDDLGRVWAISSPSEQTFAATPGDTISLITFGGARGVGISGVRWPLENATMPIGTHGVSNVAESDQVTVRVGEGALILVHHFRQT